MLKLRFISKFILLLCLCLFSSISANAKESALLGIDIIQSDNGTYNVQLKADNSINVKKAIENNGNLTLIVNSAIPSESMEIIYDNAPNLQNVIVQKKNSKDTVILLQGENIANSKLYLKELSTGTIKELKTGNNSNIINKNTIYFSVIGLIFLLMAIANKPKARNQNIQKVKNNIKTTKKANTLRHKNMVQSKSIPSINYKVNNKFNYANINMTKPNELVINNIKNNEKVRKVG